MLQNARVTAFVISELCGENQQGGGGKITPFPQRVKNLRSWIFGRKSHFGESTQKHP